MSTMSNVRFEKWLTAARPQELFKVSVIGFASDRRWDAMELLLRAGGFDGKVVDPVNAPDTNRDEDAILLFCTPDQVTRQIVEFIALHERLPDVPILLGTSRASDFQVRDILVGLGASGYWSMTDGEHDLFGQLKDAIVRRWARQHGFDAAL